VVSADSIPNVYDANFLRVEGVPPDTAELVAAADDRQAHLWHRKVVVDRGGDALAPRFRELGWTVTTHVVMAHRREPDRRVDTTMVREVTFDDVGPAWRETTLREPWGEPVIADRLLEAKRRVAAALPMRHFAAFAGDRIAAYCELRSDGRSAQIEDVNTRLEQRGRGLGRAVVQHALDVARRDHDVVFLEALAEDWPRTLYAKLGFDVVDERYLFLRLPPPLKDLRLLTPRLELRLGTLAELRELAEVARGGVHDPREMPFLVAWTDEADSPTFVDDFVSFHEVSLRDWRPDDWTLNLLVFHEGRVIGTQGIRARSFGDTRRVSTGSWLGLPWHGRGLGTEMRGAALALAFDGLGASVAASGVLEGNTPSLRISRKLGYQDAGTAIASPRGEPVVEQLLELPRSRWHRADVAIEGLDGLRPLFGA
jgi:RimJ/RimL family protein N-acetyltransferase/ribosomal protein S18 acetylase RimI-like enzyme